MVVLNIENQDCFYHIDNLKTGIMIMESHHIHGVGLIIFISRTGIAKTSDLLTAGDVISVDFTKDGDIDHTAIITSNINNTNESKLLTQHSIDRSELLPTGDYFSLAYLYSQDYKIYGYEMDKAPVK